MVPGNTGMSTLGRANLAVPVFLAAQQMRFFTSPLAGATDGNTPSNVEVNDLLISLIFTETPP